MDETLMWWVMLNKAEDGIRGAFCMRREDFPGGLKVGPRPQGTATPPPRREPHGQHASRNYPIG
jgi:hypothetical protein